MNVVLIHGLGGSGADLLDQLGPIIPSGLPVFAPDVRGHGPTAPLDPSLPASAFSIEALTDDIAARIAEWRATLLAAQAAEPLTVIGTSMGAAIALRLGMRLGTEPGELERLVFVRPAFTDVPLPHNLRAFPVIGELLADLGPDEGARVFLGTEVYADTLAESPTAAEALLGQFHSPDAAARSRRLLEIPRSVAFDDTESLADIVVPTAIAWAPRDPVHPISVAELWMDELDGAVSLPLPARDDDPAAYLAATRTTLAAHLNWS